MCRIECLMFPASLTSCTYIVNSIVLSTTTYVRNENALASLISILSYSTGNLHANLTNLLPLLLRPQ